MKKYLVIAFSLALLFACSNNGPATKGTDSGANPGQAAAGNSATGYDSTKGAGKFTHVDVAPQLDPKLATAGKAVYDLKCSACHKLTTEKLVGPGWKGVTEKRRPEWIMNFVTNTDEMITKDPHAQALLAVCMVRMPNQNLSDQDARNILEFMRQNDGVN
jgi:mono/diheme cytochrome c family protein